MNTKEYFKSQYSSTQFDLNQEDTDLINNYIRSFINPFDLYLDDIETDSHITIKYGLHDTIPNKLSSVIQNVKPVTVMLGKTSIFKSEDYDVVFINVISGDLRKLNKLISNNMEITNTYPGYNPHLTMAYVVAGTGEKYTGDTTFEGKMITFDRLVFNPAEGEKTYIYLNDDGI